MNPEPLLKANEVARRLNLDVQRVYDYARRGLIPSVRIGRILRFPPEKITEFIENGGSETPEI